MNNQEILSKVLFKMLKEEDYPKYVKNRYMTKDIYCQRLAHKLLYPKKIDSINTVSYYGYIFSPEFAKTFWGIKRQYFDGENADLLINNEEAWEYHLQQMVLYENPLEYLEKFL